MSINMSTKAHREVRVPAHVPAVARSERSERSPRNTRLALLSSASAAFFACGDGHAQAQTATEPQELPAVVVSPTRVPTPARRVASSVSVVTSREAEPAAAPRAPARGGTPATAAAPAAPRVPSLDGVQSAIDIERDQRRTVPDVLSILPGINLVQGGGPGAVTSIFMRGTNSNHTKVLVDGIDVSDPSNPTRVFDFGQMLTGDIDRIEVLRGPQSGLYGADAIGGVISITTKKGSGPPKAVATVEGGSFGTFNQTLSLSGSFDRFNYAFNVAHFRTTDTPVTPLNLLPPGRARINDFYDNVTLSTRLGWEMNENVTFNYVARYTDALYRFTGDDFAVFPSVPAATQTQQYVRQFFTRGETVVTLWDGRFKNFFGVNFTNHQNLNKAPDPTPSNFNNGERVKFDWRGQLELARGQTLLVGLEHETERLVTDTLAAQNGNKAGFIELQSELFERFFITSNARYDLNDRFGGHATWRVAPTYLVPGTETKLKASIGTGFKAPTLSQMFADFPPFFFANPNLRPEESLGYDIGFEQPLLGNRVRFGATYFHNDITNLINLNPAGNTVVNVDSATTQGVEAFVAAAVTERLRVRGDYTYTRAIDAATGLELLRRPQHKASVTAAWTPYDPLTLSATLLHVGAWIDANRDFTIPRLTAPGYTIVNVAANYTVNDNLKVFARADNLFNLHYQNPTGYERPGIGIYAGMRVMN